MKYLHSRAYVAGWLEIVAKNVIDTGGQDPLAIARHIDNQIQELMAEKDYYKKEKCKKCGHTKKEHYWIEKTWVCPLDKLPTPTSKE